MSFSTPHTLAPQCRAAAVPRAMMRIRVSVPLLVRRAALIATVALSSSSRASASLPPLSPYARLNTTTPSPAVHARVRAALLGGLAGDALALGGQYEYDAAVIKAKVGSFRDFTAPGDNHGVGWGRANYHPGKVAGDLTDAGDVAIMLLEHVAALAKSGERYDFDGFAAFWWRRIVEEGYGSCNFQSVGRDATGCPPGLTPGYLNGGTRRTLQAVAAAAQAAGGVAPRGSARKALAADVNCLVAATHFLPLFLLEADEETLVAGAISTVYLSHRNRDPVAAADFLARALHRLLHGRQPLEAALRGAAAACGDEFIARCVSDAAAKVAEVAAPGSALGALGAPFADDAAVTSMARLWDVGRSEPIKVGKASPTEGALPSALYFALRYAHSLEEALVANANVGGDSAARGMVIGMLLGAVHGDAETALPARWRDGLRAGPHVEELLRAVRAGVEAHGGGGGSDRSEL